MGDCSKDGSAHSSGGGSGSGSVTNGRASEYRIPSTTIMDYMNTVLSQSRDSPDLRLNLVKVPKSAVRSQPIDASAAAGIIAAMRMNQWFMATSHCQFNLTEKTYLPVNIMLNLLHRSLQTHDSAELSETLMIMHQQIFLHPPSYPAGPLRQMYMKLLILPCREMLDGDTMSTEGFIKQVLNQLSLMCRRQEKDSSDMDVEPDVAQLPLSEYVQAMEAFQTFKRLEADEKLDRLGLVLDFAVSVLEQDFLAWHDSRRKWTDLRKTLKLSDQRPLIVELAWPQVFGWRLGSCNEVCRRIAGMLWHGKLQSTLLRLVAVLAEVMSISECGKTFPKFSGEQCRSLARRVSDGMSQSTDEMVVQASRLKPDWLGLLVVHQAVSKIVQPGNVGAPSLYLVEACMRLVNRGPVAADEDGTPEELEDELVEPPARINKRNQIGETRLHRACKRNNLAAAASLLRQPHIDVNVADNAGWTPLHEAVVGGADCVRLLLGYRSRTGVTVDVRARNEDGETPLMDAVRLGKADVCQLLLNNAGWCLLEDVSVAGVKAESQPSSAAVSAVLRASRKGRHSLMFNNLTCLDLPQLTPLLPIYLNLYLSTHKTQSCVRLKAALIQKHLEPPRTSCIYTWNHSELRASRVSRGFLLVPL